MCSVCAERIWSGLRTIGVGLPLLILSALVGCAGEANPETAVRERLDALIQAVENNEFVALRDFFAEAYRDARHPDRRSAIQTIAGHRMRHRGVHLFSHVASITVGPEQGRARARLYLAMTGVPLQSFDALVQLHADLYQFDVDWIDEDDEWRVAGATWQRVDAQAIRGALF
ncbi:MAG: hypothetical protein KDI82_10440 [Gammaproteobacteria bacterium]|nr:hypothetical protein [Gammaproteobacteria bacterium]